MTVAPDLGATFAGKRDMLLFTATVKGTLGNPLTEPIGDVGTGVGLTRICDLASGLVIRYRFPSSYSGGLAQWLC